MGLSNEERNENLVHLTNSLTKLGQKLKENSKVTALTQKLWPALLRRKTNSSYWILGGEIHENTISNSSLFGIALLTHKPEEKDEDNIFPQENYSSFAKDWLGVTQILQDQNPELANIYKIYSLVESATYSLRRYDDEFKNDLVEYDDIICHIQGACFNIFKKDSLILDAWLQNRIIEKILRYNSNDIVNTWWKTQHIHHSMRLHQNHLAHIPTETLLEIYKDIQFVTPTVNERILLTIQLSGPRWHYKHQHRAAIALFKEHNKTHRKKDEKIDIKTVEAGAEKASNLHDEIEKDTSSRYRSQKYCSLTEQSPPEDEPKKYQLLPQKKGVKKKISKEPVPKKASKEDKTIKKVPKNV